MWPEYALAPFSTTAQHAVAEMGDRLATIDMGRKLAAVPLFFGGGELDPHVTWAWAEDNLHTKWHLDPTSRLATRHGPKIGGCVHFGEGSCILTYHNVIWREAYLHAKFHLDPSSHLATTDMGRTLGGCAPLGRVARSPI